MITISTWNARQTWYKNIQTMVIKLKLIHILQGVNYQYKDDHTFWLNATKTVHPCLLLCENDEFLLKEIFHIQKHVWT
jgi:hypothetical protein